MAERIEPAARVYAEALYAAAGDAGRTREVDSDLKALISGLGGNRPLVQALANPARRRSGCSWRCSPTPTRSSATPSSC